MTSSGNTQLMQIFNDPTYAWELLEWEIAIEMNDSLSGKAIAHLLELYMTGVERMNSLMDVRESYFKNKVTSLMMKGNVVKTLNKPPMAKKDKHLEVAAKKEHRSKKAKGETKQQKKEEEESPSLKPSVPAPNVLALQEKRREIEMRLAYEADSSSRQNLATLYHQHLKKQENFNKKINNLLSDHETKLQQRISKRKLKTATYRSRPEDTSDTFPVQSSPQPNRAYDEPFSPRENENKQEKGKKLKRHRSMELKVIHQLKLETPQRPRKNTQDLTDNKQIESQNIKSFQQFKKMIEEAKKSESQQVIQMVLAGDLSGCEKSPEELELEKQRQSI